ncbi:MAG: hypothetical protein ABSG51_07835 [Terracidiphilus sp.]|jgi:hypothetical protein
MKLGRISLSGASIALLVIQLAIVSSIAGKYLYERWTCPRVWVRATAYDPETVMRGRYLTLTLNPNGCVAPAGSSCDASRLNSQVNFYISEHAADPSRTKPGQELWIEVTVPPSGPPRPIQLALKDNGTWTPLAFQ